MKWLKTKQIRNRVFFTLLMVLIFQIGTYIPIPFIERVGGEENALTGLLNLMTGGALSRFGFLALGVSPYISASIIIQLLSKGAVPYYKKLSEQGNSGKIKLTQHTRILSLVLALVSAFGLVYNQNMMAVFGLVINGYTKTKITIILIMMVGALFTTYIGERIDQNGIGNGASVLIGFSILTNLPVQVYQIVRMYSVYAKNNQLRDYYISLGIIVTTWLIITIACIFANKKEYKLPIQSKTNAYKIEAHYFPIKLLASSVMPVIFATSFLTLFSMISSWKNLGWEWTNYNNKIGFFIYITLIFFFTYLYNFIQIDGSEIQKQFDENGTYFIGYSNSETAKYLNQRLFTITILGAPILTMIATLAIAVEVFTPAKFGLQLTGVSILILIGVLQEVIHQIKGLTEKHNYKEII